MPASEISYFKRWLSMLRRASEADPVSGDLLSYVSNNQVQWVAAPATIDGIEDLTNKDHDLLDGLGDDDHTQYALLAGRAGSQGLFGGTASGEDLVLHSTAHATKGTIFIGGLSSTITVDEANAQYEFTEGTQDKANVDLVTSAFSHNSTGNWLAIDWSAENFDPNSLHDTSTNSSRITFGAAGYYLVGASIRFAANATGQRGLRITDGTTVLGHGPFFDAPAQGACRLNVVTFINAAASSFVECEAFQNSGGNLNVSVTEGTNFWAVKVA